MRRGQSSDRQVFRRGFCQPSTVRIVIWPEASKAQNNIAAVSAEGSTVWVLIRRLKRR